MALLDRFRAARPLWEHEDPAVRAEAVRGLHASDAALVATIFRNDADPAVRRAALRKIEDIALLMEVARVEVDGSLREEAAAILMRLATESADEGVALQAAETIADARHLATLARTAKSASARELALGRLADEKSLAVVAKTAEDGRIRLHALERVRDPQARADVALKSEHKDVAVAALEGISDREKLLEIAEHARARAAARRARALLDALAPAPAPGDAPQQPPAPEPDEDPEARVRREALEHAIDSRRVLIERATDVARLDETAAAWERLPPLEGRQAEELQQQFTRTLADARARHERGQKEQQERARAEEELQGRERAAREKAEQQRQEKENATRLARLGERALALARAEAPALKDAERAMRELRAALHEPGPLPGKREREAAVETLKQARAALYPKLQELREADEWKRWANTQVQEELVARMEALTASAELDKAAIELHVLNDRWRQFSQARKQEAEALWTRFKTAREQLQARLEEHQRQKGEQEQANLEKKLALCAQAEQLAGSTDWLRTADKIKALQADWKAIGPVPRKHQKQAWDRFHAACDRFFSARKQDLGKRKDEWAQNLVRKEALIAQAEALAQSSDWDKAAEDVRKLQAEWRSVGPVKRTRSDAVWARFKAACDLFFERHKSRDQIAAQASAAVREALVAELEALAPTDPGAAAADDLAARIQDVLGRWRQAPPLAGPLAAPLTDRFTAARDRLVDAWPAAFKGTDLDPDANRTKRAKLLARLETLLQASAGAAADPSVSLADRLKEALATNAMGGRAAIEARWREAANEVEQLQAAWKRIGPVPGEAGRELEERFKKAADEFQAKRPRESQTRYDEPRPARNRLDRPTRERPSRGR
jgi:hypothetical protein